MCTTFIRADSLVGFRAIGMRRLSSGCRAWIAQVACFDSSDVRSGRQRTEMPAMDDSVSTVFEVVRALMLVVPVKMVCGR